MANGIYTCPSGRVKWRSSGENVSTDYRNEIVVRKIKAFLEFTFWIYKYSRKHKYGHPFFYSKGIFGEIVKRRRFLKMRQVLYLNILAMKKFGIDMVLILVDSLSYIFYKDKI